jgi:hypothetical protein
MASRSQLTKMTVGHSCNRFQISLIRFLGLPHQQLPYFILQFKFYLKVTIIIHQHFHLLFSKVQLWCQRSVGLRLSKIARNAQMKIGYSKTRIIFNIERQLMLRLILFERHVITPFSPLAQFSPPAAGPLASFSSYSH